MSRNGPVCQIVAIELLAAWGPETLYPENDDMIARYNADPDAFAAAHFGLSLSDYHEWLDVRSVPLAAIRPSPALSVWFRSAARSGGPAIGSRYIGNATDGLRELARVSFLRFDCDLIDQFGKAAAGSSDP